MDVLNAQTSCPGKNLVTLIRNDYWNKKPKKNWKEEYEKVYDTLKTIRQTYNKKIETINKQLKKYKKLNNNKKNDLEIIQKKLEETEIKNKDLKIKINNIKEEKLSWEKKTIKAEIKTSEQKDIINKYLSEIQLLNSQTKTDQNKIEFLEEQIQNSKDKVIYSLPLTPKVIVKFIRKK